MTLYCCFSGDMQIYTAKKKAKARIKHFARYLPHCYSDKGLKAE